MAFSISAPAGRSNGSWFRFDLAPYIFILPAVVIYVIFNLGPVLASFVLSFFKWDLLTPTTEWTGFNHYNFILNDNRFWNALSHNFIFLGWRWSSRCRWVCCWRCSSTKSRRGASSSARHYSCPPSSPASSSPMSGSGFIILRRRAESDAGTDWAWRVHAVLAGQPQDRAVFHLHRVHLGQLRLLHGHLPGGLAGYLDGHIRRGAGGWRQLSAEALLYHDSLPLRCLHLRGHAAHLHGDGHLRRHLHPDGRRTLLRFGCH